MQNVSKLEHHKNSWVNGEENASSTGLTKLTCPSDSFSEENLFHALGRLISIRVQTEANLESKHRLLAGHTIILSCPNGTS